MLINFSVLNFKTFREKASLSLVAKNYDKCKEVEAIHQVNKFHVNLLKTAVVYGANGSGKSKLLEALLYMKQLVIGNSEGTTSKIELTPFKLHADLENALTAFEVTFIYEKELFRYGFEIKQDIIVEEWLLHRPKTKEVQLFYRQGQEFEIHARYFSKGKLLVKEGLIRENTLLLSLAAQFNDQLAGKIHSWFSCLHILLQTEPLPGLLRSKDKKVHDKLVAFLQAADIGIENISFTEPFKEQLGSVEKAKLFSSLFTTHRRYDENQRHVADTLFSMEEESAGVKKLFVLAGALIEALEKGSILIIDDLDAYLHVNLVTKILSLFNSKVFNPNNAQLIFTTHATRLLSSNLLRRDQIYFTEKDSYGAAQLFSLAQFKDLRKKANFEQQYLQGYYGAIPSLDQFEHKIGFKQGV